MGSKQERAKLTPDQQAIARDWSERVIDCALRANAVSRCTSQEDRDVQRALKALGRCKDGPQLERAVHNGNVLVQQLRRVRPGMAYLGTLPVGTTYDPQLNDGRSLVTAESDELEQLALKRKVCGLMDAGATAREAVIALGLERDKVRWAQRAFKAFRGGKLVADGRRGRTMPRPARTPAFQEEVMIAMQNLRKAQPKAIHTYLAGRRELEGTLPGASGGQLTLSTSTMPSYSTVKRAFKNAPQYVHLVREGGVEEAHRQARPIQKAFAGAFGNDRWEVDHTRLDIRCQVAVDGKLEVHEVWLSAAIDAYSRRIMGIVVSAQTPNAWTVQKLLRVSVMNGGDDPTWGRLPQTVVTDRGMDFTSRDVTNSLGALGVEIEQCPPHYPDGKPYIERWFRTVTESLLPTLPGAMVNIGTSAGAAKKKVALLPDIDALRTILQRWIDTSYNVSLHSTTGEAPLARWKANNGGPKIRMGDLHFLLLPSVERTVAKEGVRISIGNRRYDYWWDGANLMVGQKVLVRQDPDDRGRVYVYEGTGDKRFIAEARDRHSAEVAATRDEIARARKGFRTVVGQATAERQAVFEQRETEQRERENIAHLVAKAQAADNAAADKERSECEALSPAEEALHTKRRARAGLRESEAAEDEAASPPRRRKAALVPESTDEEDKLERRVRARLSRKQS